MPYHHYRQTRTNSCGASSLLCAALELGTTQLPSRPAWPLWTNPIALDTNLACELAIYSVTCGGGGLPPAMDAGYSLPSYIFDAATAMGRQATAYVPSSLMGTALTTIYSGDVDRARTQGMTIHRQEAPAPGLTERLLRVVRVGENVWYKPALGLHYIMQRPDGSLMDPALGLSANSLDALQKFQGTQGASYVDTGIGIIIG